MPRTKGSLNKKTILRMEHKGERPEPPDAPVGDGNGDQPPPTPGARQFDSLDELRQVARIQLGIAAREQRRQTAKRKRAADANASLPEAEESAMDEKLGKLLDRARIVLKDIVPYEHHQLRALTITPEPLDLSKLTNEQLTIFTQLYALAAGQAGDAADRASHTVQ